MSAGASRDQSLREATNGQQRIGLGQARIRRRTGMPGALPRRSDGDRRCPPPASAGSGKRPESSPQPGDDDVPETQRNVVALSVADRPSTCAQLSIDRMTDCHAADRACAAWTRSLLECFRDLERSGDPPAQLTTAFPSRRILRAEQVERLDAGGALVDRVQPVGAPELLDLEVAREP
jgi:hypothetical protein